MRSPALRSWLVVPALLLPGVLSAQQPPCAPDNGGLALPEGFCAVKVADQLGAVRHLVVAPNGDLLAAVDRAGGGVTVLRDTSGDGRADLQRHFGPGAGSGIALGGGYLYFSTSGTVVRWPWAAGQLEPAGDAETIVQDLPASGDHFSKSLALGSDGLLYVNIGSATNNCQADNRAARSPGLVPCTELETRAGIWRFDPSRRGQHQSDGTHFATGMRNAVAIAFQPATGHLFAAVHGRDQLGGNWGYSDEKNAELPAEEFAEIHDGTDLGWPYCYFDQLLGTLVQAPEYGGDGVKVGPCAAKQPPLIGFPGHWAPIGLVFYDGLQFPARYRGGAFIAFHGSWNRAPLPQAGYRVVFVPFAAGRPTGDYSTFATMAGNPTGLRPTGLAVGPDGSLYVGSDASQSIWRIMVKH
jgi:glucose/arabinose dehydrogenase